MLADSGRYLQPFMYLYRDRVIPTTEKPPLYPTVLALPSALGLDSYAAHRVVSCLLGAAAVVLIGLLGRRVGGPRVGLDRGGDRGRLPGAVDARRVACAASRSTCR